MYLFQLINYYMISNQLFYYSLIPYGLRRLGGIVLAIGKWVVCITWTNYIQLLCCVGTCYARHSIVGIPIIMLSAARVSTAYY